MNYLLRQCGFYVLIAYCGYTLIALLWLKVLPIYALKLTFLAAIAYCTHRLLKIRRLGLTFSRVEVAGYSMLLLSGFSLVLQSAFLIPFTDFEEVEVLDFTVRLWVNGVIWFLFGAAVSLSPNGPSRSLAILCAALFMVPVVTSLNEQFVIDYSALAAGTELEGFALSHLATAEFMVVLFYAAYSLGGGIRLLLVVCILFALFAAGGRSSFYTCLTTVLVYEILANQRRSLLKFASIGLIVGLVVWTSLRLEIFDLEFPAIRAMLFLDGIKNDSSYLERVDLFFHSVGALPGQALFGDPTFMPIQFNYIGTYLHNLLSAWQFFGLPVFLLIVFNLWLSYKKMISVIRKNPSPIETFGALLLIYTLIGVTIAKYVGFYYLWFCIGFWMSIGSIGLRRVSHHRKEDERFVVRRRKRRRKKVRGVVSARDGLL